MGSATVTEESHHNADSAIKEREVGAYDGARVLTNGIPLQSTSENSPEGSQ